MDYLKQMRKYREDMEKWRSTYNRKKLEEEYNKYLNDIKKVKDVNTYAYGASYGLSYGYEGYISFEEFVQRKRPKAPTMPKDTKGWIDSEEAKAVLFGEKNIAKQQEQATKSQKIWTQVSEKFRLGTEAIADGIESAIPNLERFGQIMQELGKPQHTMAMESYSSSLDHMQKMVRTLPATAAVQINVERQNMELQDKRYPGGYKELPA